MAQNAVSTYQNILTADDISAIVGSAEVQDAKARIDAQEKGTVQFAASLSDAIKAKLYAALGLDLTAVSNVPMRWIKGDTPPHIDKGPQEFEKTYLIYITNGPGTLFLGEAQYPIVAGDAFVFNEGIYHETKDTGTAPRLLLGPMSEAGAPVGISGSLIQVPGGETVYVSNNSGTLQYSTDQLTWNNLSFPATIQNTNTAAGILKVIFLTDIQLTSVSDYFIVSSEKIQFGSESLSANGQRRSITITANNYEGLIENGGVAANGYSDIYVYNLFINGDGYSTQTDGAWIGKKYFGKGAARNYFINCSSSGDIKGGGIVGDYAVNITFIGCSSSGVIFDNAGGIVGQFVNTITAVSCWSTGAISGNGAGGIVGSNSTGVTATNCYSEGIISGPNAGGIVSSNAGSCAIEKCYSRGNITGGNAGGICGSIASGSGLLSVTITNCYTTGNLNNTTPNTNGAICGLILTFGSGTVSVVITNCYTTGTVVLAKGYMIAEVTAINGTSVGATSYTMTNNYSEAGSAGGSAGNWRDVRAGSTLQGAPTSVPGVGNTWATLGANTPYEIATMGYTPYQTQVISGNALVQSASETVEQGGISTLALTKDASGNSFAILQITGGDSESYALFAISPQTGGISVPAAVTAGTYTIFVRSVGSYNITRAVLTVRAPPEAAGANEAFLCCSIPLELSNLIDYSMRTEVTSGNIILANIGGRQEKLTFADMIKIKKAKAAKR